MLEYAINFNKPNLFIKEFEHWVIVCEECPQTLGHCVFIPKKETLTFSNTTTEQMAELSKVCFWFENTIKNLFGAVKFNYSALMLRDNYVHFQAIPRYDKPIQKYGMTFIDEGWPRKVTDNRIALKQDVLNMLINDLKK